MLALTIPFVTWELPTEEDRIGEPLEPLAMEIEPPSLALPLLPPSETPFLALLEARAPFPNDNEGTGGAADDTNVGCDAGE